jgi:low affinity Fe/Cu permease
MERFFTAVASRIAGFVGQPEAFVLALASIVVWAGTGPVFGYSDTWQLVVNTATTVVTFLMVFLIQNSQNRDAAAMQAKLDEIIGANSEARNRFIGIEHLTEHQLRDIRAAIEAECAAIEAERGDAADEAARRDTVSRLLRRL